MSNDPVETYFDAASVLLELPILPEYRDEALAAFKVLMMHAQTVTEFKLPEAVEAAPRFIP